MKLKSLRYTTAITVSLIALSTANQTYAQCLPAETAGDDVINCTGINGAQLFNDGGNDTITIAPGASLERSGNGSVLRTQNNNDITLNNDGNIEITGGNARFQDVVLIQRTTGDINITNTGTILNNSTNNTAISAAIQIARDSNFNTLTLDNTGTISSTRQGIYFGSLSRGNHLNATYVSSDITNQAGGIIESTGAVQDVIFFNAGDDTLTNNGTLTGDVSFNAGDDVFTLDLDTGSHSGDADGGTHIAGDILNIDSDSANATIVNFYTNFETLNLSGDNDISIGADLSFEDVNLLGTTDLIVTDGNTLAASTGVFGTGGNDITIDSGGTLSADTTLTAADEVFTLNGVYNGNLSLGGGDDLLAINFDTAVFNGTADGGAHTVSDTLDIFGSGEQVINLSNFTNFEALDIDGGGRFITSDNSSGTYETITVQANTDLVLGQGSTLTSNGAFFNLGGNAITLSSDSTLTADSFAPPADLTFEIATDTSFGQLNVTGGPVDITGANITALIADAVTDGDIIPVATGVGQLMGLVGAGQTFTDIDDTSLLFNFGIADGGQPELLGTPFAGADNTLLVMTDRVFLIRQVIEEGNERNVGEVLEVLEVIPPGINDPQIQAVLGRVASAGNSDELRDVLSAALPAVDGGSFSAAQNVTGNTLRLVTDRLTVIRDHGGSGSGVSSGDLTDNLQVWTQAFGQKIDQDPRGDVAGFKAITRGVTFGVDTEAFHENATIGAAFSYANTDVSSESTNATRTDIDSYNISLYGDYDITNSAYLVGDIGYTYGDTEAQRFNVGGVAGLNAQSDYGSHQFEARLIAASDYNIKILSDIRVTPKIEAHYIRFQNEDIDETGAGGAGLSIDSEALNILDLGVGLDIRKDFTDDTGGILSPEISVGYSYDVIGDPIETTSRFQAGGPSFTSEGADPDQNTFNLGLGLGYTSAENVELTLSYDYENKDEFHSHSGFIRMAAPF